VGRVPIRIRRLLPLLAGLLPSNLSLHQIQKQLKGVGLLQSSLAQMSDFGLFCTGLSGLELTRKGIAIET